MIEAAEQDAERRAHRAPRGRRPAALHDDAVEPPALPDLPRDVPPCTPSCITFPTSCALTATRSSSGPVAPDGKPHSPRHRARRLRRRRPARHRATRHLPVLTHALWYERRTLFDSSMSDCADTVRATRSSSSPCAASSRLTGPRRPLLSPMPDSRSPRAARRRGRDATRLVVTLPPATRSRPLPRRTGTGRAPRVVR